jgi:tRNA (guanine10-N2)-dimethyltransferase
MKIIFELSKEYINLPKDEILYCLKTEKINYKIIESNQELLIISTNINYKKISQFTNRLSLTYNIGELLFTSLKSIKKLKEKASKYKINNTGSIAIKYRNRSINTNSQKIVKILAEIFTINREVNLNNPDIEIRCLITNKKIYVSRNINKIDRTQFGKRKVQFRPFFSPISLHPKLSRVMINLSMIRKNEILLDPFCGTGGILIEAGILGVKVIGNDIDKKLVKGCEENLKFYNITKYNIYNLDIGEIHNKINKIDAVVSDFPYGKSTTTNGEELSSLYKRAFINISKILKEKKKAVIGLSNQEMIKIGEKYLLLENIYDIKVHNSLTRYIAVFNKK